MTENLDQSAENQVTGNAPASSAHNERMLKQSEVDNIVKGVKMDAYRKGKEDAMQDLKPPVASSQSIQPPMTQSMGGMTGITEERARQLIAEEQKRAMDNAIVQKIASEFNGKIAAGAAKYPDFLEVTKDLRENLHTMPEIAALSNSMDNTADIIYDLAKNPHKIGNLLSVAQRSPALAQKDFVKLSESIKQNEAAKQIPSTPDPLSQIKSSITGIDNGKKTVADRRRDPLYQP